MITILARVVRKVHLYKHFYCVVVMLSTNCFPLDLFNYFLNYVGWINWRMIVKDVEVRCHCLL
jgi:hypothetical protein